MFKKLLNKKLLKNQKGLTLIELLAVIVILAIVAAIAVPAIGNIINKSRDRAILAEGSNILAGAKIAHLDGECDDNTCNEDDLAGFVDGIDFTKYEVSVTYTPTGTGQGWAVTYSRFGEIKNTELQVGGANGTTPVPETTLNTALTNSGGKPTETPTPSGDGS
ncbi:prepilin-type N-terminal cleavage/methylation domain-containing protein [Lysinibacillus sp. FSL H8-0500]|uniref:prepilin-type N-terminal cleavage/methylation domain-containing protein n=1 Tax=Lysinibacillus sp. FSL H8-0500 TaxID=2921393 RepID=UPI003101B1F5